MLMALLAAACSNSDDDDDVGADETTTTAGDDEEGDDGDREGDRDTFVPISGVPGVTDEAITFAAVGTQANNPLGTCVLDCYLEGIQAYFDYRNAEGGIYGRELVLGDRLDDELANNQARVLEVISGGDAFGVFVATQVASGYGDLDAQGVPAFTWNIHATEAAGREAIFPQSAVACVDCKTRSASYLIEQAGASKVGVLGYGISENSKVCAQTTRDAIELYSGETGAEVAFFNDELQFGLPNGIAPEVTEMKRLGVDFISTCIDLNGMKALGEELDKQGMIDQVTMYHPNTYDQDFVNDNARIFEGDYVGVQFLPFEAESGNELQQAFMDQMENNGSELSELAMVGFINAHTAFTGLLEAGPEFDRQAVIDGLNALNDYDAGGLVQPIDWGEAHTPPESDVGLARECVAVVQVVDGAFETLADPSTPWLCWDEPQGEWGEPEQVAFG